MNSNLLEIFNIQTEINTKEKENENSHAEIDDLKNLLQGLQNHLENMEKIKTYHESNNFLYNFRK
jgi:hypothetical protein